MRRLLPLLSLLACAPGAEPGPPPCDDRIWYQDGDRDGFGDEARAAAGCEPPAQGAWVPNADDCDDTRASVAPGAVETCDGADQDCDGLTDEAPAARTWYADADGDGYGDTTVLSRTCDGPGAAVEHSTDCDDTRSDVFPGAVETCDGADNDCDGVTDDSEGYADADGDGFGDPAAPLTACTPSTTTSADATDCDDTRFDVFPGAVETCDGVDQDCDGSVDEYLGRYHDADRDGYGTTAPASVCDPPEAVSTWATDCDDTRSDVFPEAVETCDGADEDCDGAADESGGLYVDADGDGFGDAAAPASVCDPAGAVADATDCDDTDGAISPDAPEVCDRVDQDCDGYVDDDATDGDRWYADCDGDGYGNCSTRACFGETPDWPCPSADSFSCSYAQTAGDCNDGNPMVYLGSYESCDGYDENCNGLVDDGAGWPYCMDRDGDGYGDPSTSTTTCTAPAGYVNCGYGYQDCDDSDPTVYDWALETCDGVDEDCNGLIDDHAAGATEWYADADGDGYGDPYDIVWSCTTQPGGSVSDSSDCDDTRADVHPGAAETCDGADDDCDGTIDEDVTSPTTWYADGDGDGYGAGAAIASACDGPSGAAADDSDCDDGAATVFPGAPELCDAVANDCDTAAIWSSASEAGLVARESADGLWEDVTAELGSGFHVSPPAGSTTWLCAGTYAGTFEITEDDVTIEGRSGAGETILARTTTTGASAIAVSGASGATLRGLTITSGAATGTRADAVAGIDATYADDLLVEDCAITGLVAARAAAGAAIADAAATFRRVTFSDNLAWRDGTGGLYVTGADVVIEDCAFDGNRTSVGSGAALRLDAASAIVSGTTFADNAAGDGGAAVHLSDSALDLSGSALARNTASLYGGALAILGASTVTCASSTFDGNSASEGGAIAFPTGSTGTFAAVGCDFGATTSNAPDDVAIGAAYSWSAAGTSTFACDAIGVACR